MKSHTKFRVLLFPMFAALAACGGGGGGGGSSSSSGGGSAWQPGIFQPSSTFKNRCASPRAGTSDRQGSVTDQNNWLRSWSNELYLWYSEISDRDPALYTTANYFKLLKTTAITASGADKDKFHFTKGTAEWQALSQGGVEAGYGAEFAVLKGTVDQVSGRKIVVAFTESGTPAFGQLARGDEVIAVDGADAVNGNTQTIVDTLNAGLFPGSVNEPHTFQLRDLNGNVRSVTLTSAQITHVPVPIATTFATGSGTVGYIQFNDHIATAESQLEAAINTVRNANASDLILDLRYNGGGYLDIASEVAYMIANTTLTNGRTFEHIVFNDKNPNRNPVTGETLSPTPFWSTSQGFVGSSGRALPTLNLNSVYVIVGPGTCSASESIINSLRGVGVNVYLIGSTTCGKPYGFYPQDNCSTTYFSIEFRGENAANFGDYTDGFSPANQPAPAGTAVAGCSVADDFSHPMGDSAEARIAAALAFRASNNQTCPAASGFSVPRVSKTSFTSDPGAGLEVSKPAARQNRILRMSAMN